MEQELESLFIFKLTPFEALVNLAVALFCGVLISLFYRWTYKGVSYSSNFVISIIMLSMITALVIMVIGNNLARAFGLVGAMSIIRFRTAVKDTQDIMFIFFSLASGLACGAGMYIISITGTLFVGISAFLLTQLYSENPKKREFLLQLVIQDDVHLDDEAHGLFEKYCSKSKLINAKSMSDHRGDVMELSYYVKFRNNNWSSLLVRELKKLDGVHRVNLFYDEE